MHISYSIAITEAVCNAFRYNRMGEYKGQARIQMVITDSDITTRIYSNPMPCSMKKIYSKLSSLASDPMKKDLDWGIYTQESLGGRGLWYMLYGADNIQVDDGCREISLFIAVPSDQQPRQKKISQLFKKLYIKENGVVI